MTYFVEDPDIAIINSYGIVRGVRPGVTAVRASGFDQEITFNVTVEARPATERFFRVYSRADGFTINPAADRTDTGTFYAFPSDRLSSLIEGLLLVGTDTVFCNRCFRNPSSRGTRNQRLVNFRSLNPEIATISNAANPFNQQTSTSGNAAPVNTDTTGRVRAFDTSSTPVGFVMDVPGDGTSDTVWITFKLRPITRINVRPDSADFVPSDIDDIGTERRVYPNSDTTSGNFTQSTVPNFAIGLDYIVEVRRPNSYGSSLNASVNNTTRLFIQSNSPTAETYRAIRPIVTWESALPSYLQLQPAGINIASVSGACAFVSTACGAPTLQTNRNALVIDCLDTEAQLPGFHPNGQIAGVFPMQFSGPGSYSIPGCNPAASITPYPGALCTTAISSDLQSFCRIWVRASVTDPANGATLIDLYPIQVRR
jgi:hypothetical protein